MGQPAHIDDCVLCGREIPEYAYAVVVTGMSVVNLCHRNEDEVTCYEKWTVFGVRPASAYLEGIRRTDG